MNNKKMVLISMLVLSMVMVACIPKQAEAIVDPYIIEVTVFDEDDEFVEGASVRVEDVSSRSSVSVITDDEGWAWYALDELSNWEVGDEVTITVTLGNMTATETFTVESDDLGGKTIDLTISSRGDLDGDGDLDDLEEILPSTPLHYYLLGFGALGLVVVALVLWVRGKPTKDDDEDE